MINFQKQRGIALILLFLAILLTGMVFIVTSITIEKGRVNFEKNSAESLSIAKEALISYAASYYERVNSGLYGFLPCPETVSSGGEGVEQGNCTAQYVNSIGRLPWKTLGLTALKDGSGECLWYAVTGMYKNGSTILADMHNDDSPGMFNIYDINNNLLKGATPEDRVIAVLIAPGTPLAGQARPVIDPSAPCKYNRQDANNNITQFLDGINGLNNAALNAGINQIDSFATITSTAESSNFNDRIVYITQADIFNAINRQTNVVTGRGLFESRIRNLTKGLGSCIASFAASGGGGSCDVSVCQAQCATNNTSCENLCSTNRTSCRSLCDDERDVCRLTNSNSFCAQQRNSCRAACDVTRDSCTDSCGTTLTSCNADCVTNCTGGAVTELPWAAPADLGADYRVDTSYDDDSTIGYFGRFPFVVDDYNSISGSILSQCGSVTFDNELDPGNNLTIDFSDTSNEYYRLWQHWKDHFFYAVSKDYSVGGAGSCGVCIKTNSNNVAAIILFSGIRDNQLRRYVPPEPAGSVNPGDSKIEILNYLETGTYPDLTGNSDYTPAGNDIAYCINSSMNVVSCP